MSADGPPIPVAAPGPGGPRWKSTLLSAYANVKVDRVNVAAGAFAYRWFLSFFPTIIALLGFTTLITVPHGVVVNLINGVTKALPAGAAQVFTEAIANATQRTGTDLTTTVVASIVALWSATSGMVIVEEGLDMAYDLASDRSFLAKRVVALPLLVGGALLGGAASALIIFGPQLGHLIEHSAPVGGAAFAASWTILRWIIALSFMNLLFTLLYYLAPNRPRPRWRWTSSGAVLATVLWALVSLGFSLYTSNFGSFGTTYGAFAGVAILIFWLYLTGLAILVGGEVNAAVERLSTQKNC
ncbi:MAG TPA: YihY/virulence factor BrkB family protein [Acidimicrobiales bacterium]|nr:YihY/virulence factor BrkB family protein [Acidimicrobiales bacterium]